MPDQAFNSLDEYEAFILAAIEPWSPARRVALAAAMAERWLPAYEAFSTAEGWGDPAVLRRALDAAWETLPGRASTAVDWPRLRSRLHNITPPMDDFDANEALCACVMVQYAIDCCTAADNRSPALLGVLSGLEAVQPDLLVDDHAPSRFWKRAALQKELRKQLRLIEQVGTLAELEDAPRALRSFLAGPGMAGEVRPRRKGQGPAPGLSNRVALEQYRRMVGADIKGASRGLDPRKNPEFATALYISAWLGRYHRRKETIAGGYGVLADQVASNLLVARNRARDLAEKDLPAWESSARWHIDLFYRNGRFSGLDAGAPDEPHGYGPSLRRLWLEAKRRGLSDAEAWGSIGAWARHEPEGWGAKAGRGKRPGSDAAALREHLARPLTWSPGGDADVPWATEVDGQLWQVRLNDFPDEVMYSLLIGGQAAGDFDDWPKAWKRE